jgi:hypothetical protein
VDEGGRVREGTGKGKWSKCIIWMCENVTTKPIIFYNWYTIIQIVSEETRNPRRRTDGGKTGAFFKTVPLCLEEHPENNSEC